MSTQQVQIFVDLPPELQKLLDDNHLSIADILYQENITADLIYGSLPDESEDGTRSKDPVLIILASAVLVMAVGSAISRVLHTLHRKPQLVEYFELIELTDIEGNILLDKKGKPQFKKVKRYELLEPRKENNDYSSESKIGDVVIKFSSSEKQLESQEYTS